MEGDLKIYKISKFYYYSFVTGPFIGFGIWNQFTTTKFSTPRCKLMFPPQSKTSA
jgi:hypothetical protein